MRFRGLILVCATLAAMSCQAARLYSETFSGRDGSDPVGLAELGDGADWIIHGQELVCGSSPGSLGPDKSARAAVSSPESLRWGNYFVQTDFWIPGPSGGAAVIARCADAQNYYEGRIVSDGQRRSMEIDRVFQGTRVTLARQDGAPGLEIPSIEKMDGPRQRYVLRLVVIGDTLELSLNGRQKLRTRDSSLHNGTVGVAAIGTAVHFDNIIVDDAIETVFKIGPTVSTAGEQASAETERVPAGQISRLPRANEQVRARTEPVGIQWYSALPEAMAEAARTGKKILIYFHSMDEAPPAYEQGGVLADALVQQVLDAGFIAVQIDIGKNRDLAAKLQASQPGIIMIYDSAGNPIKRVEQATDPRRLASELRSI